MDASVCVCPPRDVLMSEDEVMVDRRYHVHTMCCYTSTIWWSMYPGAHTIPTVPFAAVGRPYASPCGRSEKESLFGISLQARYTAGRSRRGEGHPTFTDRQTYYSLLAVAERPDQMLCVAMCALLPVCANVNRSKTVELYSASIIYYHLYVYVKKKLETHSTAFAFVLLSNSSTKEKVVCLSICQRHKRLSTWPFKNGFQCVISLEYEVFTVPSTVEALCVNVIWIRVLDKRERNEKNKTNQTLWGAQPTAVWQTRELSLPWTLILSSQKMGLNERNKTISGDDGVARLTHWLKPSQHIFITHLQAQHVHLVN